MLMEVCFATKNRWRKEDWECLRRIRWKALGIFLLWWRYLFRADDATPPHILLYGLLLGWMDRSVGKLY